MIARNKVSEGIQWLLDNPASVAHHAVRYDQFLGLEASVSGLEQAGRTHLDITDWDDAVLNTTWAFLTDSQDVLWFNDAGQISARVKRQPGGYVETGPDGLHVDVSSSGLATKADIVTSNHPAVTPSGSPTVSVEVLGPQTFRWNTTPVAGGGILATPSGLNTDWSKAAEKEHTHTQLHDAATGATTATAIVTVAGQQVSVTIRTASEASGRAPVRAAADGLYVELGASGNMAAPGNHTHPDATEFASGFATAEMVRQLNRSQDILAADQVINFTRHDQLPINAYVGGRHRWGQAMEILSADLTADAAGVAANSTLAFEIGGVIYDPITLPAGISGVASYTEFTDLVVPADTLLRIVCTSGIPDITMAPSRIDVSVRIVPASITASTVRINCGGDADGVWAEDAYYDGGSPDGPVAFTIDVSAVTDPAPQGVYKTVRNQPYSSTPLNYTIPGLKRGLNYKVRLHFAELTWTFANENKFNIRVTGATEQTTSNYDIIAAAGAKWKADIKEYTLKADTSGTIRVQLQPLLNGNGTFFASLNGIELVPQ